MVVTALPGYRRGCEKWHAVLLRSARLPFCPCFDGVGAARLAVQDLLNEIGLPAALTYAGFAELDQPLARAVEAHWGARAALGACIHYHRLADDVWDWLRQEGGSFTRVCE